MRRMKNDIPSNAGAATEGIDTEKERMDVLGVNQSHALYIPGSKVLISLGGGMVNKIDHYKIHEVQKS